MKQVLDKVILDDSEKEQLVNLDEGYYILRRI